MDESYLRSRFAYTGEVVEEEDETDDEVGEDDDEIEEAYNNVDEGEITMSKVHLRESLATISVVVESSLQLSPFPAYLPLSRFLSGQSAWQIMIAYDAYVLLCLYAWPRGCTEAPEFLHDECLVLRSAFGCDCRECHQNS